VTALAAVIAHWRLALALGLAAAVWIQTERLEAAQQDIAAAQQQLRMLALESQAQSALSGPEAVTAYVDQSNQDRPVVERVVTRVRHVCLREPAGHLPMPAGAGDFHAADPGAGDAADRARADADQAFAEAVGRDLAKCNDALNLYGGFQQWKREHGG
jgi:hypothetical protein